MAAIIAAIETHEDEMAKGKRVPIYIGHLRPQLEQIHEAIVANLDEMAKFAEGMTPPYPFIPFTELEEVHRIPKVLSLVSSALMLTQRNMKNISVDEWKEDIAEYLKISAGGGPTHAGGEEDTRYTEEMSKRSDDIANYLEKIGLKTSYMKMAGKTSHKMISYLAIRHAARFLAAVKAKQN